MSDTLRERIAEACCLAENAPSWSWVPDNGAGETCTTRWPTLFCRFFMKPGNRGTGCALIRSAQPITSAVTVAAA